MTESYADRAKRVRNGWGSAPAEAVAVADLVSEFEAVERETLARVSDAITQAFVKVAQGRIPGPRALMLLARAIEVVVTRCSCGDSSVYQDQCPTHGAEFARKYAEAHPPGHGCGLCQEVREGVAHRARLATRTVCGGPCGKQGCEERCILAFAHDGYCSCKETTST